MCPLLFLLFFFIFHRNLLFGPPTLPAVFLHLPQKSPFCAPYSSCCFSSSSTEISFLCPLLSLPFFFISYINLLFVPPTLPLVPFFPLHTDPLATPLSHPVACMLTTVACVWCAGIPSLVILDEKGGLITMNGRQAIAHDSAGVVRNSGLLLEILVPAYWGILAKCHQFHTVSAFVCV